MIRASFICGIVYYFVVAQLMCFSVVGVATCQAFRRTRFKFWGDLSSLLFM